MKIIIIGAGDVGAFLCQSLAEKGNDVIVIEKNEEIATLLDGMTQATVVAGDGCSAETLVKMGVSDADYVLAMTSDDQNNIISSSLAKGLGAKHSVARIHDRLYSETAFLNYQLHFGIDHFIHPEALAAAEMAKLVRNPEGIAIEAFSRGNIAVQQIPISPVSTSIHQPFSHLQVSSELRLLYIIRDNTLILPSEDMLLEANDLVTLLGPPETLIRVRERLHPESGYARQNVMIYGGTEMAISLARLLHGERYQLSIIENDHKTCQQLADLFPKVNIIEGDGTSRKLLEEQQISASDFFIASSKSDENNIMTAIQAIQLGAKHTQTVIHRSDYEPILEKLQETIGLKKVISPRVLTTKELLRYLSSEPYSELSTLPNNSGKLWEIRVTHDAPASGQLIKDLNLPKPAMIIALTHKFHTIVPSATNRILEGDRLIIASKEAHLDAILNCFTTAKSL